MIIELEDVTPKLGQTGTVVLCHGVFDVIHAGHVCHFEEARSLGGMLVVSLTPDQYVRKGPNRPIFNQNLRARVVDSLEPVDYVVINGSPDALDILSKLRPDIYCKGSETARCPSGHLSKEMDFVRSYGGRMALLEMAYDDEDLISSSRILNRTSLADLQYTNALKGKDLDTVFTEISNLKVLVVGETIIDEYIYCRALSRAGKEMVVPVSYEDKEGFLGGASIVALNIAQFCDSVALVTTGCKDYQYPPNISVNTFGSSTIKQRLVERGTKRKMAELTFLEETFAPQDYSCILSSLKSLEANVIVCLDYGHGFFSKQIINYLTSTGNLCLTVQTNAANYGFNLISNWPHARYLVADEKELRLTLHDRESSIDELASKLLALSGVEILAVTLGHKGSIFYAGNDKVEIPAFPTNVVDTMGAGDAFISISSLLLAIGQPLDVVAAMSNVYGAMKVSILGNRPVDPIEYKKVLRSLTV